MQTWLQMTDLMVSEHGVVCWQVVFSGQSFMLHQIRHMIGAAVAVARGTIPLDYVEGCLRSPSRAIMPLAPPHVRISPCTSNARPAAS